MTQWEYVKGSEADFEGAPEWATLRTYAEGRSFYAEHHDKGAQIYDICAKDTFLFDAEFVDLSTISVTAQRRKMPTDLYGTPLDLLSDHFKVPRDEMHASLQSRVNDEPMTGKHSDLDADARLAKFISKGVAAQDAEVAGSTPEERKVSLERILKMQKRATDASLQSRVNDANLQQFVKVETRVPSKEESDAYNKRFDTVQRPAHYNNQSGIECIDAIAASMTPAEFQAYLKGNVQKYLWRYQHKNGVEDCRKAQWYLGRLVKELSK